MKEKTLLLTGASSGIGAAIAKRFLHEGYKVSLVARNEEKLIEVAGNCEKTLVLPLDLSDPENARKAVRKTIGHFGGLDILINNAAGIMVSETGNVSVEYMERAYRINVLSPLLAIQEYWEYLNEKDHQGQVINIGSPGFLIGIPYYAPYVCSKAALSALTRTLQAEVHDDRLYISEYFPGYIQTDSKPESLIGDIPQDLLMKKQGKQQNFFTKAKTVDDVAKDIFNLAARPKKIMYSGWEVCFGSFLALFSSFRNSLGRKLATQGRKNLLLLKQK